MTQTAQHPHTVDRFLAEPLRLGDPRQVGNLTLFPLFGPEPKSDYISFAQGRSAGVRVGELEGGASVNDLMVENPGERSVFLFEGEEVIGAQQNRTFDVSVLVAAGSKVVVPVSCMEHGRWDGRRHREEMRPAPQTANPRMRRAKAEESRLSVSAGTAARANQSRVWSDIDQERALHAADAPTGASHDIYESRRDRLNEICAGLPSAGRPGRLDRRDQRRALGARLRQPPRGLRLPARAPDPGLRARRPRRRERQRPERRGLDRPRLRPARRRRPDRPPHPRRRPRRGDPLRRQRSRRIRPRPRGRAGPALGLPRRERQRPERPAPRGGRVRRPSRRRQR